MKTGIHPDYKEVTIRCACGETVVTRSTKGDANGEIRLKFALSAIPSSPASRSLLMQAEELTSSRSVLKLQTDNRASDKIRVRTRAFLSGFFV